MPADQRLVVSQLVGHSVLVKGARQGNGRQAEVTLFCGQRFVPGRCFQVQQRVVGHATSQSDENGQDPGRLPRSLTGSGAC